MIVSIHHYELSPEATPAEFLDAVREAERRNLFDLPGLVGHQFVRGIKGTRTDGFTALWYYESREAWAALWGTPADPIPPAEYPESWRTWESELLAPVLDGDPDRIDYTTYEVVGGDAAPAGAESGG